MSIELQNLNQLSGAALIVVGIFSFGYLLKQAAALVKAWRED
jgi:hypothetical protein